MNIEEDLSDPVNNNELQRLKGDTTSENQYEQLHAKGAFEHRHLAAQTRPTSAGWNPSESKNIEEQIKNLPLLQELVKQEEERQAKTLVPS